MSTPLYQKWAKGSIPGGDKLQLISRACGVSVEWLLGLDSQPPPGIHANHSAVAVNGDAVNHPPASLAAPYPDCARKDATIARLERIIDKLTAT